VTAKTAVKRGLLTLGGRAPERMARAVDAFLNYVALGSFLRGHGLAAPAPVASREDLFGLALQELRDRRVLYLEFGVHEGRATRWWSEGLRHPESVLQGFDSFEGLPERWNDDNPQGKFAVGGSVPQIDDDRVTFVKGWFADTLAGYVPPRLDELFVMIDADLYSSTICVLDALEAAIVPGTYLYFDELADRNHELAALDEFLTRTGMRVEVIGVAATMTQWLFRVTAAPPSIS
jgi:O-methyltransferase